MKNKIKTGRPSKYKPSYCNLIINLPLKDQHSAAIAIHLGVNKSTILEWGLVHPEFSIALQKCRDNYEQFWLNLAVSRAQGNHQGSDTLIKFMLSAACGYREKTDITQDIAVKNKAVVEWSDE